jgi:hypothetical protein
LPLAAPQGSFQIGEKQTILLGAVPGSSFILALRYARGLREISSKIRNFM